MTGFHVQEQWAWKVITRATSGQGRHHRLGQPLPPGDYRAASPMDRGFRRASIRKTAAREPSRDVSFTELPGLVESIEKIHTFSFFSANNSV